MLPIIRPKLIGPCPLGRPLSPSEEIIVVSDDEDNEVICEQTTRITEWRVTQVTTIIERQQNNHKKTVPLKT